MTLSTNGPASAGLVYITMAGVDASGRAIVEQGSGVLLSADEVLTAAHLVYNDDGTLRTSGSVGVAYDAGASAATAAVDGVQVGAKQTYNTLAGMGGDYAVVHLSTKVAAGTLFSVGSDLAPGTFSVSGYPVGTAGALDTKAEQVSVVSGTSVYAGESLHDGAGDPNGSSGGPVYRLVDGTPTAYGVISADLASDTTKGYFKAFTADDVAQIRSWVAAADGGTVQGTPLSTTASQAAPGFSMDVAAALAADAEGASGGRQAVMTDVAGAIAAACRQGGSFADMVESARSDLSASASLPGKAIAYLAGLLSGTTGTWSSSVQRSANILIPGAVRNAAQRGAAGAGRQEGLGMALSNTSALISPDAAALAGAIAGSGAPGDVVQPRCQEDRPVPTLAAGLLTDR